MKNPIVSIVVLSLLRQEHTRRCIESVFVHTVIPFEMIVVDMGQSNAILDWLKRLDQTYQNLKVIYNDDNIGTTKGRNQGIVASTGKYLVFLDNDTEAVHGWLKPLIAEAEASNEVAACGSKIISPEDKVMFCSRFVKAEFDVDEKLLEIGLEFKEHFDAKSPQVNKQEEVLWYPSTCLLVKQSVFDTIGGFDENIFMCEEDKDICLRIRERNMKILYVPKSEVYHHHESDSKEYKRIRYNMPALINDVRYFKNKWKCGVFIRHSRTYLHQSGMTDSEIDRIKKFSFLNTILEEELKVKEIILTVTNRCNHLCEMCYYHEHLNKKISELTLDEYRKIAASLNNLDVLWISGGEPFVRDDLAEICNIFVDNTRVKNIFIPTNGSRPDRISITTKKILEQNRDVKLTVMFSLEGLHDEHDAIHGKKGAFKAVEESVKKLNLLRVRLLRQKRYFNILLNSVVTTENINCMIPLMRYVQKNLWVDSHFLSPMRGRGRGTAHLPPKGKDLAAVCERALQFIDFYSKKANLTPDKLNNLKHWMTRRYSVWCDILDGKQLPFKCQAGNLIGVIEPDGGIRICELKQVVANIRDFGYSFPKVWFSEKADQSRSTKSQCSCTHACFLNVGETAHEKMVS